MSVTSPCIKVCLLNADDICTGCGRTITEIAFWSGTAEEQQQQIVEAARARLAIIARNTTGPTDSDPA